MKTIVIGLGTTILRDDGVGVSVERAFIVDGIAVEITGAPRRIISIGLPERSDTGA